MPDEIANQIDRITSRLQKVAVRQSALSEEIQKLRKQNADLKRSEDNLHSEIRQLKEQVFILKSSVAPLDEKDRKTFEKSINEYLRTIDKCIAMLKS